MVAESPPPAAARRAAPPLPAAPARAAAAAPSAVRSRRARGAAAAPPPVRSRRVRSAASAPPPARPRLPRAAAAVALLAGLLALAPAATAGAAEGRRVGGAAPGAGELAGARGTAPAKARAKAARGIVSGRVEVRALQRALGVPADGLLGPRTRAALRRAQRRAGLRADGVPRRATLAKLGISTRAPRTPAPAATGPVDGAEPPLVAAARTRIGSPYEWGATGPDSFDCSGLVTWSAQQAGIEVPRVSFDQYQRGVAVARDEIEAGDLVFFDTAGPGASDVGIATGPRTVISATTSRGVIEHATFDRYWGAHFVGARRLG